MEVAQRVSMSHRDGFEKLGNGIYLRIYLIRKVTKAFKMGQRLGQVVSPTKRSAQERSRYASLRLMPGEMICTDNWRVMHSRSSFLGSRHEVSSGR